MFVVVAKNTSRILDWTCAGASLIYGIYALSWLWIAGGILGLALAYWNPAPILAAWFISKITGKSRQMH